MFRNSIVPALLCLVAFCCSHSKADIIQFQLTGNGGLGLLAGNVNPHTPTSPGSGGIGGSGIFIDTDSNTLHVDLVWGSGNGFSDMSGTVTNLHLHGMTADPAPGSFNQTNTNILINLGNSLNFDDSATDGGLVDNFFVSNAEIEGMLEGRSYINVHTALNPNSEVRGYLVAIPEPGSAMILMALLSVASLRRRPYSTNSNRRLS